MSTTDPNSESPPDLVRVQVIETVEQVNARGPMTAKEFEVFSADNDRCELLAGKVKIMSPAGFRHGRVTWRIAKLLGEYVEKHDLGVLVAAETGFLIRRDPDTVRAADIAFVSTAALLRIGDYAGFAEVSPDLVIEVKSRSDRESAIIDKTQDWFAAGTSCAINVDPETRSVRVDRADGVSQRLNEEQELSVDVVPGWKPKVAELFA